jgi:ATP phosphoribosyltransferase regulatory subunit HisZ
VAPAFLGVDRFRADARVTDVGGAVDGRIGGAGLARFVLGDAVIFASTLVTTAKTTGRSRI